MNREVNMYHYSLYQDDITDTPIGEIPYVAHITSGEALNAAYDDLVTRYGVSWPVHIRIYDSGENYVVQSKFVWHADVMEHWRKAIDAANRAEFAAIIEAAHAASRAQKEQYEKGLITPLDFAKEKVSIWTQAAYDIESKG